MLLLSFMFFFGMFLFISIVCKINYLVPLSRDKIKASLGSGVLFNKMLLVRIVENNEIDDYFRAG